MLTNRRTLSASFAAMLSVLACASCTAHAVNRHQGEYQPNSSRQADRARDVDEDDRSWGPNDRADIGDWRDNEPDIVNAVYSGDAGSVLLLFLAGKADPNALAHSTIPVLVLAAQEGGNFEIVRILIDRGADVNLTCPDGRSALATAAGKGHVDVVKHLLRSGAKTDQADSRGFTPLMLAARNGHEEIVRALLRAGANKSARTIDGLTALDLARMQNHSKVEKILN